MTQTEPVTEPPADDEEAAVEISQWEFIDRVPTRSEVMDLLNTLPPRWGVRAVDYAEYVVGLPSNKKVKVDKPHPQHPDQTMKVDEYHSVYTLYMSVAGRIAMMQQAQEQHGWSVSFTPDLSCSPAGFVMLDERIVYREVIEVIDDDGRPLGEKSGTAWVPSKGGQQAAGSNPFEKVETSARGRALAAWGFGVLPGSGVASLEEMLGVPEARRAMQAERVKVEKSRPELIDELYTAAEELRQIRGDDPPVMLGKLADYVRATFGKEVAVYADGDAPDDPESTVTGLEWEGVKDGQIQLTLNQVKATLAKAKQEQEAV